MQAAVQRPKRNFLPEEFQVKNWNDLEPFYTTLLQQEIHSKDDLEQWLRNRSELESAVSEDMGWRYIRMTCDTGNKEYESAYLFFVSEIEPNISPLNDQLNRKFLASPYADELDGEKYKIYLRSVKREIEIFREENIPLFVELNTLQQHYASITSKMMVTVHDKEYTLQQAANFLKDKNRELRHEVYVKINERRLQDKQELDELMNKLIALRHQVAHNAGFLNFRDFMFAAMGRFDYTPKDCFNFHNAIEKNVVPFMNELAAKRKADLKLDALKPWDLDVDTEGKEPLKPFSDGKDLTEKSIECFNKVDPWFGECLEIMNLMKHLDLESRKGKAPGGYNYPLAEVGVPFIFMNAAGNVRDLQTMVHEGGHAVHSFLTKDMELNAFKSTPSEVAELASMSMELISMDGWDAFFKSDDELRRAMIDQLEGSLETLPWVATVDKFQHWLYENPLHTVAERTAQWTKIFEEFASFYIDWSGQETYRSNAWQKQLHIYEVPFYYIEYGMAQLGAIAMWKNYKENKKQGIENYKAALKLGYTKTISEIYEAGGIRFDFSEDYVKELVSFIKSELKKLEV